MAETEAKLVTEGTPGSDQGIWALGRIIWGVTFRSFEAKGPQFVSSCSHPSPGHV